MCPKQYEFANVKKIPRQISAGESFGASVHNTLRKWGERETESGKRKAENDQLHLFGADEEIVRAPLSVIHLIELWHSSFIVEGYATRKDADAARKRGETLMRHFFEWWSREPREIIAVEKGFVWNDRDSKDGKDSKDSKEITITGRFDRVEKVAGGVRIIDYKTTAPREQENVDEDLQLSIYALAAEATFGLPCVELVLLFLREDGITEVISKRSPEDLVSARSVIKTLADGISSKDFHADPAAAKCGRCPYRGICPASAV